MKLQQNITTKKLIKYSIFIFIAIGLTNCQPILKGPVATIYSASLPTPEIDIAESKKYPMADFNLLVTDLNGNLVKMENYRGKVIFLNFWATWCMPCVAELPSIDKLYNQFKNEAIVFLLISNERAEKVKDYKRRKGYEVPFMIQDNTSKIPRMYYSPGIPTTFIINKKGQIIKASGGAEDWDDKEFVETVRELVQ